MILVSESANPATNPASYRILKKLSYLVSARWLREAFQAVFLIYLARQSTTTYGEFMLALSLGKILMTFSEFGLNLSLVGSLTRGGQDSREALGQVMVLKTALLSVAILGALGFLDWQDYHQPLRKIMLIIGAGVGMEALTSTFFVALQVEGRQDQEGIVKTVAAGLGFGYGMAALILGASPLVVAFFKPLEALANLAGGLIFTRGHWRWQWPDWRGLADTARLGLVFAFMQVAAILYNHANIFFLQRYGGPEQVAQYNATWQMVDGFSVVVSFLLLQSIMFPLFVKLWEVDRQEVSRLARVAARWLLTVSLVLMFVLYCERDRLILLIYGPHYQEAVWLQQYLVITISFAFLHNLAAFLMMTMRRERLLLIFYLGGLLFNLLWCSQIMPVMPLLGAALAIILTKAFVGSLTITYIHRRVGLFTQSTLSPLLVALVIGTLLYVATKAYLLRIPAEALGLAPLLILAGYWWRKQPRKS